jgi:hypothetical protein
VSRDSNFVGDWYTAGQRKCPHCGGYYPENWAASHVDNCTQNPANQVPESDDE